MQRLRYENICGMLVRRDGWLHWRCPDCGRRGRTRRVRKTCPHKHAAAQEGEK